MRLSTVLNHPIRRDILRVLHASEQPCSVTGILSKLPRLKRGEVGYHLQVLQNCGVVVVDDGTLRVLDGAGDLYRSAVADDVEARAVLQATEREDLKHREGVRKGGSSDLLTMFRGPRPDRTITLRNLLGRKTDPEE